ncbi:MAG: hypothetical protein JW744_04385 [Candidatus Diapherotrites archaeon]|uniref:Uncharacterized protein n=1 Tax=Candidatus Iainarchaeum sp. TaxID=3101447 RepID=A0A938YV37_9ARCH|nr:hypothetical protein [Candidatus Diapherotrites archaeon]
MIGVSKQAIKEQKKAIAYLFAQLTLVLLSVYQILFVAGLQISWEHNIAIFTPSKNPVDCIILVLMLALLASLSLRVKKKQPDLFSAEKRAASTIKSAAKQKLANRKDERAIALMLIELMFVCVVVIAAYALFDPEFELIPWHKVNIYDPLTTALNAVVAVVVLGMFYWVYSHTAWYRKS